MAAKPPRTLFSVDAVFPKLMLMCTGAFGGLLLAMGLLLALLVATGRTSGPTTILMWCCIAVGITLMVVSRVLFGRFIRGYLHPTDDTSVD
ncbi:hypothetical protein [Branchiibius sp. NY16-3462-2]|uniref:hypothetical protein n=1 Tax=Branchiibius sp. NY16-3462-2 TaxID=1807500 RepID=UPI00079130F8|nr:hypothetical protein [Branchiibius sp. NY16-3462-2]KYH43383.1 hypothetical protein AZH51_16620 [Branchiibius sp. NY16-3462-2]